MGGQLGRFENQVLSTHMYEDPVKMDGGSCEELEEIGRMGML